jgi:glycosyltransferase involved in cell wall biosynthesis
VAERKIKALPKSPSGPTVAFVTTCKGRLHHLQQTLPLMMAQRPHEMIVVDYSCGDGTGAWVEANFPAAKVVRVPGKPGFNLGDARNHGAAAAASDWLFFVDADIRMTPEALATVAPLLQPGGFYMPKWIKGMSVEVWGSCVAPTADYRAIGGYDEVIEGWGHEDEDFYHRLQMRGIERRHYPPGLLVPIAHGDEERDISATARSKYENEASNAFYAMAKRQISQVRGGNGNLPIDERRGLMKEARRIVGEWYAAGAKKRLQVRLLAKRAPSIGLASGVSVHGAASVTVVLAPLEPRKRKPAAPAAQVAPGSRTPR